MKVTNVVQKFGYWEDQGYSEFTVIGFLDKEWYDPMATQVITIENAKTGELSPAVREHPLIVRLCHWVNAISLLS